MWRRVVKLDDYWMRLSIFGRGNLFTVCRVDGKSGDFMRIAVEEDKERIRPRRRGHEWVLRESRAEPKKARPKVKSDWLNFDFSDKLPSNKLRLMNRDDC